MGLSCRVAFALGVLQFKFWCSFEVDSGSRDRAQLDLPVVPVDGRLGWL